MPYRKKLSLKDTQFAIRDLKYFFQKELTKLLNLERISGPLILDPKSGLNDDLTENLHAVSFNSQFLNKRLEIVQSLAKWKRYALHKYNFAMHEGIYVDMNAIRHHEDLDELHSLYVDQWDWEIIISDEERKFDFLRGVVNRIYQCIQETEDHLRELYPIINKKLTTDITYLNSQELETKFPDLSFDEIVYKMCKEKKAIFIEQIGWELKSGKPFDDRSPEYDDWSLNGDLYVWSDVINKPIELMSMGIRVNKDSLIKQTGWKNDGNYPNDYYKMIVEKIVPQTIGGGIGQSRLCMFLLEKAHIGEVQSSVWPQETIEKLKKEGIELL